MVYSDSSFLNYFFSGGWFHPAVFLFFKSELEHEHQRLAAKNEKCKAIDKELERVYEQSGKVYRYQCNGNIQYPFYG